MHQGTCNRKTKGIKILLSDQKKRHQGTCNRIRKGINVLAIEKENVSRYLQLKKKRHQDTGNRTKENALRYFK